MEPLSFIMAPRVRPWEPAGSRSFRHQLSKDIKALVYCRKMSGEASA
ncbi:MAG: hypothetical protein ACXWJF_12380 [Burkholderiaceae bacterium]